MNAQSTIDLPVEKVISNHSEVKPSDLGWGYDSLKRKVTFQALEVTERATSGHDAGGKFVVEYDYRKIRERFGLKTKGSSDTGITKVELSVDVSSALDSENMSVYIFYFERTITESLTLTKYTISDRAKKLIEGKVDNTSIYKDLGNQIITNTVNGGELMMIARFSSRSSEESKAMKVVLEGNSNIFGSKVNFDATLNLLRSKFCQDISFSITPLVMGGEINVGRLSDPLTFHQAVGEWKNSLKKLPTVLEYECRDLRMIDPWFTNLCEWVNKNQAVSNELDDMLINMKDTETLAKQYQKSRRELKLPESNFGKTIIGRCKPLRDKLVEQMDQLRNTAATAKFTLDREVEKEYKDLRQNTPVFNYRDMPKGASCGFQHSGMPPFGDEMAHVRYFESMDVITDVGLQGFSVEFDTFNSPERVHRSYAQNKGNHTDINMKTDLLISMHGWAMPNREGHESVRCVQFTALSGKTYGALVPPADPNAPTTIIGGNAEEGSEKYIIGLWGNGNNWVQRVGPYFRECTTEKPYQYE